MKLYTAITLATALSTGCNSVTSVTPAEAAKLEGQYLAKRISEDCRRIYELNMINSEVRIPNKC